MAGNGLQIEGEKKIMAVNSIRSTAPLASRTRLNEADRKYLENITGKQGATGQWCKAGWLILFMIKAGFQLYLATFYAGLAGYAFPAFCARFSAGTSTDETYTGTFIKAADYMTNAILYVVLAIVAVAVLVLEWRHRARCRRILKVLQNNEAL
jgi:hypothetical protein